MRGAFGAGPFENKNHKTFTQIITFLFLFYSNVQPAEPCNIFNFPNRLGLNSKQGRERENDDTGKGCGFFSRLVLFLKKIN